MSTRFQGRITAGPDASPRSTGEGVVELIQYATINRDATLVQSATFELPIGSIITGFIGDVLTAYDSATSATMVLGSALSGSQYASAINAKTGGRNLGTVSAAQATAGNGIASSTVVATITSVGQPTVGSVRAMITYIPPNNA